MKLEPIRQDLLDYLAQRGLVLKWKKTSRAFLFIKEDIVEVFKITNHYK